MESKELFEYIKSQLHNNVSKEEITKILTEQGGWEEKDVADTFSVIERELQNQNIPIQKTEFKPTEEKLEQPKIQPEQIQKIEVSEKSKKKTVPTRLGSLIILLAAVVAGGVIWQYGESYIPPETVDVSKTIEQIKESREVKSEIVSNYEIKEDGIYYQGILIEGVDKETFEVLGETYAKDKNYVYYVGKRIEGADPVTFEVLNEIYSKDKSSVYKEGEIIKGVNLADFTKANLEEDENQSVPIVYNNPVHGYSFSYTEDMQLVAAGNIPYKLKEKGVESMQDFNLNDGDAVLIKTGEKNSEDNIVYTILELSKREGYITFDEYLKSLRLNLTNTTESAGTRYMEKKSFVGKEKVPATEFFFEMDVMTNQETKNSRVGVFYDTLFEMDGRAYSVSFGYPKEEEGSSVLSKYRHLLSSFQSDSD